MAESLAAALAELQATPPRIRKKADAQYGKYADLPAVTAALRPALAKLSLVWQTWPTMDLEGRFVLRWSITHLPSGDQQTGDYPIHATDPQRIGSEITYARRYALVTVTGVTPEGDDDDGASASGAQRSQPARTRTRIPGPEHERLRQGAVQGRADIPRATEWTDHWEDQPAGALSQEMLPEDRPGTIDTRQIKRLQILYKASGIDDRDVRIGMVREFLDREVGSVKDLSRSEADRLIKHLEDV